MTDEEQNKSDMDKLAAQPRELTINGTEITVPPLKNKKIINAAVDSDRRGEDDSAFLMEIVAMTLNKNEGFDVTRQEVEQSQGNILPLMNAVQQVNGLEDFLEEGAVEEAMSR